MTKVIDKEVCPCCGQTINQRQIVMFTGLVEALYQVWKWCIKNKRYKDIKREEFKSVFKNENSTGRFGDWKLFMPQYIYGKKGRYNFDVIGIEKFFNGQIEIPTIIMKRGKSGEFIYKNYKNINQIPNITEFLTRENDFIVKYSNNNQTSLF